MSNKKECTNCKAKVAEEDLCPDEYCRACHVSIGFEECCDGSWVDRQRAAAGLPPVNGTRL